MDLALKPNRAWPREAELSHAALQSPAHGLNPQTLGSHRSSKLKKRIGFFLLHWQQTRKRPRQEGCGADGSRGATSALPLLRQRKGTGRAGEGIRTAPAWLWINGGFTRGASKPGPPPDRRTHWKKEKQKQNRYLPRFCQV